MTSHRLSHSWDLSFGEARRLQETLAHQIRLSFPQKTIRLIAGADVSFNKFSPVLFAGVVVLSFPDLLLVEERWTIQRTAFPYVPGYLSFREAPAVIAAFEKVKSRPDVMILDGQGIAHPRGLGLASHVGLLLGFPTVGCAKSLLVGKHIPVPPEKGASVPLIFKEKEVGKVLRTRTNVKPVFVSPGHMMDIKHAAEFVLRCCPRYRLPEPTRQAHFLVNRIREEHKGSHAEV